VDAVLRDSREWGLDPAVTLDEAYPFLGGLVDLGLLRSAPAAAAAAVLPTLSPGDEIAGLRVASCLRALEDTELYLVRGQGEAAFLKLAPAGAGSRDRLLHEAAVLAHLGGSVGPRLLGKGEHAGASYLLLSWCPGVHATVAADELRQGGRAALLALCQRIAAAYAELHGRGVLHGDVHPGNVLVGAEGDVHLVDFGLARWQGTAPTGRREGISFFFEPEYARAILAGAAVPEISAAGEQYGLAALLYLLASGEPYRDFALQWEALMRQIAGAPPFSFAERSAEPWPEVEVVLGRALAKDPGDRFPTLAHFADALGKVRPARPAGRKAVANRAAEALLAQVLDRLAPGGPLAGEGPAVALDASLGEGTAGLAYALYRIALAREDPGLLALADLWATRARQAGRAAIPREPGFGPLRRPGLRASPYVGDTGPACVQALVAHAMAEPGIWWEAVQDLLPIVGEPGVDLDLYLGRPGLLLAGALLLDTAPAAGPAQGALDLAFGSLLAALWADVEPLPAVADGGELPDLGMAHGWAGVLYAVLRWCRASGQARPPGLADRLAELAGCAEPWGRGLRWRGYDADRQQDEGTLPGWCTGSAGFVHLWTLAHETFGEPLYRRLAEGAAWNTWETPEGDGSLCCGLTGRAYALLHLYRHGAGPEWLRRARELAERAAADLSWAAGAPDSLYLGEVGLAVLAADLARPESATMPFFEEEGWR
ncbi:MAG TPA: lanthionine synthetase LanC family protein, partial [Thermoanaerobaculia bacterium]|nr:lanthionine synthetase LanC family protein [Thermoanaerobaculia bacterium]